MFTESFTATERPAGSFSRASAPFAGRILAADLATDPADLLDLSAALGVEFRSVVAALLRTPERPAADVLRSLAVPPERRPGLPSGGNAPFVWVRLRSPGRRQQRVVRAGWLVPDAVAALAAEARAVGTGTEIQIIVPLDGGDGAAARVHALCLDLPPDLTVTIDVQRDRPAAVARRTGARFRPGTWVVLEPLAAV